MNLLEKQYLSEEDSPKGVRRPECGKFSIKGERRLGMTVLLKKTIIPAFKPFVITFCSQIRRLRTKNLGNLPGTDQLMGQKGCRKS